MSAALVANASDGEALSVSVAHHPR
jgi:hypothetical protein